jgi:Flp pilus assembly protein CpaB
MTQPQSSGIQLGTAVPSKSKLWVAVGLGIVAAALNGWYLSNEKGNPIKMYKVGNKPIFAGSYIYKSQFVEPPIVVYSQDLREMAQMAVNDENFDLYAKTPLAENLKPGQILLKSAFQYGAGTGVRDLVKAGEEAVSIPVDKVSSVGGAVRPGDRVNIYSVTGTCGSGLLMKGVLVLAVDADALIPSDRGNRDREYTTVTVAGNQDKVRELIGLIQSGTGKVYLTLVAPAQK